MPTDRDQELAAGHGDGRGTEGGDLNGAQTRRDEGQEGSIAQSDGLAGTHPARIDAGEKLVGVLGIEAHQIGSILSAFWSGFDI